MHFFFMHVSLVSLLYTASKQEQSDENQDKIKSITQKVFKKIIFVQKVKWNEKKKNLWRLMKERKISKQTNQKWSSK